MMTESGSNVLNVDNINPNFLRVEYAVRGPIVERANELEKELNEGAPKPFKSIIKCNIGDCQATGQKPVTFFREVIAAMAYPTLLQLNVNHGIPSDVQLRVKRMLESCPRGAVGSYSHSLGLWSVRQDVAKYIERRDGVAANPNDIFLSCGASEAVKYVLHLLSTGHPGKERAGIMVPIPQYPLYSATNAEYDAYQIDYYLDESKEWGMNVDELQKTLDEAKNHCIPRGLVVINPGNPTGQVLSRSCMEDIIKFCLHNRLVLLADEVYQLNIYQPDVHPWTSFKRVLHDMGPPTSSRLELASFMSCSKGFMGECGFRGGYCELINFDPKVQAQLYKVLSARLCPPVLGQAIIGAFVNPPVKGEPSYDSFCAERDGILNDLKIKAQLVTDSLNSMEGMSCNPVQGAMYAFPRIHLPPKAIKAAEEAGQKPDFFYCLNLLEEKGICVVPGSGFGQKQGTYHFRTTILPSVEEMKYVMKQLKDFHTEFMAKYA